MMAAFKGWLGERAGGVPVAMVRPGDTLAAEGLSIILHHVERGEAARVDGVRTLDALLLVVAGGKDAAAAATLSGEAMFALHDERWSDAKGETRRLQLESGTAAEEVRRSLGLPPGHAVLVRLPLHRQRDRLPVVPVREPMVMQLNELGVLDGVVMGELKGGKPRPIPDARIEARDFGRFATTDRKGQFRLSGLPDKGPVTLAVAAKGRSLTVSVEDRTGVVVRVPIE
jgi:hypothetical protein